MIERHLGCSGWRSDSARRCGGAVRIGLSFKIRSISQSISYASTSTWAFAFASSSATHGAMQAK
jgi:hypothetical protein